MKPISFGIVGEYQSGKSLLINCLLQRSIATVGVGIATTHTVVNYRYSQMEYVEYVDIRGEHHTIPIEQVYRLDTYPDIMTIDVYLTNDLLKTFTLSDMPGFGANEDDNSVAMEALRHIDYAILVATNDKSLGADSSAFKSIHVLKKYKIPYYFILNCRNTDRWHPTEEWNREIATADLALLNFHQPMLYPLEEDSINIVNFMWYWFSVCEKGDELLSRKEVRISMDNYEISDDVKSEVGEASNFCLIKKIFDRRNRAYLELRRYIKDEITSLRRELCPIGTIQAFAFTRIPKGWLFCDGRLLSKDEYTDLYNVIGYTFGGKRNKFALPDLRGRFIRGWNNDGSIDIGRKFGSTQDDAIQSHSHTVVSCSENGRHHHKVAYHNENTCEANTFWSTFLHKHAYDFNDTSKSGSYDTSSVGNHKHEIVIGDPCDTSDLKVNIANETRPNNVALMFCIKVKESAVE